MTHTQSWDHHVPWSICPHCGVLMDGAANVTGTEAPEEGDPCMCFECGEWAIYKADGSREKLTDMSLLDDPEIQWVIATYWAYRAQHPERWPT